MRTAFVRHAFAASLVCVLLEPTAACQSCTLIGCESSLTIELDPPGPRFANGSYRLTWVSDDDSGECEFVVVDDDRCTEGLPDVCVELPSCASAFDDGTGRINVQLQETPERLQITLEQDDAVVLDTESEPDYDVSQPNGEGCDPVCTQGTVALAV